MIYLERLGLWLIDLRVRVLMWRMERAAKRFNRAVERIVTKGGLS